MKKTLLVLALLLSASQLSSQIETAPQSSKHILGFSFSTISGVGLSYQYVFDDNFRAKITGFYYSSNSTTDKTMIGMLGSEVQLNLHSTSSTRFYTFMGFSYCYEEDIQNWSENHILHDYNKEPAVGLGVGFEYKLFNSVVINLDAGYEYAANNRAVYFYATNYYEHFNQRNHYSGIGGGVGIGYAF